ncbi:MAG: metallophosphoesterase [Acidobacteria bacterium]|nr:metallophosphoesterase [Acidobacteriota bacterium]
MSVTTRTIWQTSTLVLGPTDRPISKWRQFRNKWRRRRGIIIFWSLIIGPPLYGFAIEPMRLVVRKTAITLPAWPEEFRDLRVTVFSDLHVGPPHITLARLRRIVEIANATEADLILMPGDFVETALGWRMAEPEEIVAELKRLRANAGVFATLGNHDWWYDSGRVRQAFEKEGIRVLDNQAVIIEHQGKTFWLAGFADAWAGHPNIEGTLRQITDDAPVIAFTHNPEIFPTIPARVTLTIAGHTHGGQIWLPFIGRPVISDWPYTIGHIIEGGRHLFVTPGIGTSICPVRFGVPPEISVLTIR